MNARISHYTILSKLGAGGMGEVYKAHDTILDRPVALKILPLELVQNEIDYAALFRKRNQSSLNHRHIITIYEVGEAKAETSKPSPKLKANFSVNSSALSKLWFRDCLDSAEYLFCSEHCSSRSLSARSRFCLAIKSDDGVGWLAADRWNLGI